jgi:hypothetical protein
VFRRKLEKILERLSGSTLGGIFLCNLEAALHSKLVDSARARAAFDTVDLKTVRKLRASQLLGHLKPTLQDPLRGLILQNDSTRHLDEFSPNKLLVTVMPHDTFDNYYAHPGDAMKGHDFTGRLFASRVPGATTSRFALSAVTKPFAWVAPTSALPSVPYTTQTAEQVRDALGLVHFGKKTHLVALVFEPPTGSNCYRPTVVDANPNSRFRQINPEMPAPQKWGTTVDLDLLDRAPNLRAPISGSPELTLSGVKLSGCGTVRAEALGQTLSDRDTDTTNEKFLEHLLNGRELRKVENEIVRICAP